MLSALDLRSTGPQGCSAVPADPAVHVRGPWAPHMAFPSQGKTLGARGQAEPGGATLRLCPSSQCRWLAGHRTASVVRVQQTQLQPSAPSSRRAVVRHHSCRRCRHHRPSTSRMFWAKRDAVPASCSLHFCQGRRFHVDPCAGPLRKGKDHTPFFLRTQEDEEGGLQLRRQGLGVGRGRETSPRSHRNHGQTLGLNQSLLSSCISVLWLP